MKEYIERKSFIEKCTTILPDKSSDYKDGVFNAIKIANALPKADVKEVAHGKWSIESIHTYELSYGATAYEPVYKCSACGRSAESYLRLDEPIMPEDADFPDFCPKCGAIMDESEE